MNATSVAGLASIVIPCWNQLEFTRQCIAALVRHTRPPWELIVIDNGSTDGTAAYLNGVQDAAAVPVTVISNQENLGFPAAVNQGLQQARGEYLVLLNNDVVVTDAWLDQLIGLAEMRVDSRVEGDPPPFPPPQGGRHLNAQANVECSRQRANLTMIDFNGGEPVVVDGSIDGFFRETGSPAGCLADSASAPHRFDLAVAGRSLTTPLAPPSHSDFSGWVYLTSSEAKIEFKPVEPRNPWIDAFSSELGRQVLVVLS
jgi:GT2 family glycosyltransferase